jgi:hypothetical protein
MPPVPGGEGDEVSSQQGERTALPTIKIASQSYISPVEQQQQEFYLFKVVRSAVHIDQSIQQPQRTRPKTGEVYDTRWRSMVHCSLGLVFRGASWRSRTCGCFDS